MAQTSGSLFESQSLHADSAMLDSLKSLPVIEALDDSSFRSSMERFTLTRGIARHHLRTEEGESSWHTAHERLHISLVHAEHRVELNLDCEDPAAISSLIRTTALALTTATLLTTRRLVTAKLHPAVAAQFWRVLVFSPAASLLLRHDLQIGQQRRFESELDGNGAPLNLLDLGVDPPSNVYRPSYRTRPIRLPFNVRVRRAEIEQGQTEVSLLAITRGPELTPGGDLETTVLCADAESGQHFIAFLKISPDDFCARITSIRDDAIWFPEMAGVFGSETLLQGIELLPI